MVMSLRSVRVRSAAMRTLNPDEVPVPAWEHGVARVKGVGREATAALLAAADALARCDEIATADDVPDGAGVIWCSTTAGAPEYSEIVADTVRFGPGMSSPRTGPMSGYNGCASAVSIGLGLRGPCLSLIGGTDKFLAALAEAAVLVEEEGVPLVVVGVSEGPVWQREDRPCAVLAAVVGPGDGTGLHPGAPPRSWSDLTEALPGGWDMQHLLATD